MISAKIFQVIAFAGGDTEGGGGLLDLNIGLAFWTVLTFLLLLFILKKLAWKPILSALDERENAIKESLEKAEKAKEEAQKMFAENQASIAKAEEEARKIVAESRAYAEKLKEQLLNDSKQQAQKLLEDAKKEIEQKKEETFNELKNQIAEIAVGAAEKIMMQNLDKNSQDKLVEKYIQEITKN